MCRHMLWKEKGGSNRLCVDTCFEKEKEAKTIKYWRRARIYYRNRSSPCQVFNPNHTAPHDKTYELDTWGVSDSFFPKHNNVTMPREEVDWLSFFFSVLKRRYTLHTWRLLNITTGGVNQHSFFQSICLYGRSVSTSFFPFKTYVHARGRIGTYT